MPSSTGTVRSDANSSASASRGSGTTTASHSNTTVASATAAPAGGSHAADVQARDVAGRQGQRPDESQAGGAVRLRLGACSQRLQALVVGIDGIGKHTLARAMVDSAKNRGVELDVVVTNALPLKEPLTQRIDFVVCLVDMASKLSLERMLHSMQAVGREYVLNRACMVVVNAETPSAFSFSVEDALGVARLHGMLPEFCTIEDAASLAATGARMVSLCLNTTRRKGISPQFASLLDIDNAVLPV